MLTGNSEFYHALTKKYAALFGTLFNDISITRKDENNNNIVRFTVPLGYGPREKYLGRLKEDATTVERTAAIQYPRISYELITMNYSGLRMNNPMASIRDGNNRTLTPVPYDLIFQVSIITKSLEDGYKIIEQIIPYFKPHFTVTAELLEDLPGVKKDIDIVLNAVSFDDSYEGDFETRRTLTWILDFTVKGFYFGYTDTPKVIKFAKTNLYANTTTGEQYTTINTYPGLTANGEPTTNPALTIPYLDIEADDNWDYIVTVEDKINNE